MLEWRRPVPDALLAFAIECDRELHRQGRLSAHAVQEELVARGLVPDAWLVDRARRFRRTRRRRYVPRTPWDALTFAALSDELPTLEALAREAASRLRPWSSLESVRGSAVFWRVPAPGFNRDSVGPGPVLASALASLRTALAVWFAPRVGSPRMPCLALMPEAFAALGRCFDAAIDRGLAVPRSTATPLAIAGTPFANLPDPFEPLLELLARGAVLQDLRDDGLQLYAPALPDDAMPPELRARWRRRG